MLSGWPSLQSNASVLRSLGSRTQGVDCQALAPKHGDDDIRRADGQIFVVGGDHDPCFAEPRRSRLSGHTTSVGQFRLLREFSKKPSRWKHASSLLMIFSRSKWMNDLLKRYLACPSSHRDAVLLAAARMEHQGWPEARNAGAGGVANARIDNAV
jgi:hypothetical protein